MLGVVLTLDPTDWLDVIGQYCGDAEHPVADGGVEDWTPEEYADHLIIHLGIKIRRKLHLAGDDLLLKNI